MSVNVYNRNKRRYRGYVNRVADLTRKYWPVDTPPVVGDVVVLITNYHSGSAVDTDNIAKPIDDGMKGIAFVDDSQIQKVVCQRIPIELISEDESEVLTIAIGALQQIVHIVVEWDEED